MVYTVVSTLPELDSKIKSNLAAAMYFSTQYCSVCKVLKPKLLSMLEEDYPEFNLFYIDIEKSPVIAGQMRIFTIPSLLIFFGGKEFYRISRNISLEELKKTIERPYGLMF
jgi:thioredoxin 1